MAKSRRKRNQLTSRKHVESGENQISIISGENKHQRTKIMKGSMKRKYRQY